MAKALMVWGGWAGHEPEQCVHIFKPLLEREDGADALLAPSVYDTFPLMPMEAMACGLPVIISRNTGVAEIVGVEDCIVVEDVENAAELAAAMQRMATDADLRERLARNGLVLARNNRWDRIYQAVADELLRAA